MDLSTNINATMETEEITVTVEKQLSQKEKDAAEFHNRFA